MRVCVKIYVFVRAFVCEHDILHITEVTQEPLVSSSFIVQHNAL